MKQKLHLIASLYEANNTPYCFIQIAKTLSDRKQKVLSHSDF